MGWFSVSVLLVGVAMSFHDTLWPWAALCALAWVGLSAIEMRLRPDKWN